MILSWVDVGKFTAAPGAAAPGAAAPGAAAPAPGNFPGIISTCGPFGLSCTTAPVSSKCGRLPGAAAPAPGNFPGIINPFPFGNFPGIINPFPFGLSCATAPASFASSLALKAANFASA